MLLTPDKSCALRKSSLEMQVHKTISPPQDFCTTDFMLLIMHTPAILLGSPSYLLPRGEY